MKKLSEKKINKKINNILKYLILNIIIKNRKEINNKKKISEK